MAEDVERQDQSERSTAIANAQTVVDAPHKDLRRARANSGTSELTSRESIILNAGLSMRHKSIRRHDHDHRAIDAESGILTLRIAGDICHPLRCLVERISFQ